MRDRTGGLARLRIRYTTSADPDVVRRHYRRALRHHRWVVGEVDFDDGSWDIEASRGTREVDIRLGRAGGGTDVRVEITWPTRADDDHHDDDDDDDGHDDD